MRCCFSPGNQALGLVLGKVRIPAKTFRNGQFRHFRVKRLVVNPDLCFGHSHITSSNGLLCVVAIQANRDGDIAAGGSSGQ
jgi:hypothetical protein